MGGKPSKQAIGELRRLDSLTPNPLNPRTPNADDPGMAELVASIRSAGLLQPILVTPAGVIVAGHRRAVACRQAGLAEVPVLVRELSETAQLEAMLAENIQRQSLNPVETARGYATLKARGLSVEQIALRVGVSAPSITKHLPIVRLPEAVQESIADYSMAAGMAEHLAKLRTADQQLIYAGRAVREGWTVAAMARAVDAVLSPPPAVARPAAAPRPITPRAAPPPPTPAGRGAPSKGAPPTAQVNALLMDLATAFRRHPELARDATVWDGVERLSIAIREAKQRAA